MVKECEDVLNLTFFLKCFNRSMYLKAIDREFRRRDNLKVKLKAQERLIDFLLDEYKETYGEDLRAPKQHPEIKVIRRKL